MGEDFRYDGLLASPIPQMAKGNKLLAMCGSDEEKTRNRTAIEEHERFISGIIDQKLSKLFEHFAVQDGQDKWKELALCLAMRHVPGFSFEKSKLRVRAGRKATWTTRRLTKLLRDVEAIQKGGNKSHKTIKGACSYLARNSNEWKAPDDHAADRWTKTLVNKFGEAKRARRESEARSKNMPGNQLLQFSGSRQ